MAKGRILSFPSAARERPTSDFLRETLFNLLGSLEDKTFLDLYAGSGSVGLEAMSRGAREVFFVEKNIKLAEIIKKNISTCFQRKNFFVMARDVERALSDIFKKKNEFDIIFADPPYNRGLVQNTLSLLDKYRIVEKQDGVIVIQHSIQENISSVMPEGMNLVDQRKYGENILTFLKMENS